MNTLTDKQIAKLLHKAIKELVAEGIDAFRYEPFSSPTNGICAALNRKIEDQVDFCSPAYHFMRSFMGDWRLYAHGIGESGELNDHRIDTILVLDQLSLADLEFYANDSRKYW